MASARMPAGPRRFLWILGTVLFAVITTGGAVQAEPSVSEVEAQINDAWNKLEPLVEQYNMVHAQLAENKQKSDALAKQIQPLQLRVDLSMTRVGAYSAMLYRQGPGSRVAALLAAGSPQNFAEQLTIIDQLGRQQAATVHDAAVALEQYNAQKKPLDALIATETAQDADLAARKAVIEKQMDSLQQLRRQAYGDSGKAGGSIKPVACPYVLTTGKGATAARTACAQIGKPYVWAAAGPRTFDCSGLALYAWKAAGVTLRHYTQWQWEDTKPVSRADLQPGDLVFYFSNHHHMSVYVGGDWVVHAPTTGDVVRMTRLDNPYLPIAGFRRPG